MEGEHDVQQHDSVDIPQGDQKGDQSGETQTHDELVAGPHAQADDPVHETHEDGHPLEPGGKRFSQVWARAKDAEYKLQQEREDKARLQGELEGYRRAQSERTASDATKPTRYSETQLQALVDEGKATLGQVLAYHAETLRLEAKHTAEKAAKEAFDTTRRVATVTDQLDRYKHAIPEIMQTGTPERQKYEHELRFLTTLGHDPNDLKTQLLAARTAHGDPETIVAQRKAREIKTERDTMQDIPSSTKGKDTTKDDPLKDLTPAQKKHYQKMIDHGVYKNGWKDVREELAWTPPR